MSIAMTESLVFKFCTTDGGIIRVMQKRGSGITLYKIRTTFVTAVSRNDV